MKNTINKWKDILSEKDVDDLMNSFGGFHDACLVSLKFDRGNDMDCVGDMENYCDTCELTMVFHSPWYENALELHFAGLRRLHLVGIMDNYGNDMLDASIKFYDELLPWGYQAPKRAIVWADSIDFDVTKIGPLTEPSDTYVIAHTLKWRLGEKIS